MNRPPEPGFENFQATATRLRWVSLSVPFLMDCSPYRASSDSQRRWKWRSVVAYIPISKAGLCCRDGTSNNAASSLPRSCLGMQLLPQLHCLSQLHFGLRPLPSGPCRREVAAESTLFHSRCGVFGLHPPLPEFVPPSNLNTIKVPVLH